MEALEVLGISAIQRLVVPRVLAMMLVAVLLNGLVSVVGVWGKHAVDQPIDDGAGDAVKKCRGSRPQGNDGR
jgi:phospholipid/cholesterol/gamma-HCH transport system permease protein